MLNCWTRISGCAIMSVGQHDYNEEIKMTPIIRTCNAPTRHMKRAIRAALRLLSITTEGWAEGEACDRHFDGGEWSGPAWSENWAVEEERVIELVALRFGYMPRAVSDAIAWWRTFELDYWMDAVVARQQAAP